MTPPYRAGSGNAKQSDVALARTTLSQFPRTRNGEKLAETFLYILEVTLKIQTPSPIQRTGPENGVKDHVGLLKLEMPVNVLQDSNGANVIRHDP